MEKEKLIEKAKKILEHFEISHKTKVISIYEPDYTDPIYEKLGLVPDNTDTYTIFVEEPAQIIPGVNVPLISLKVDNKTHKILTLISKHHLYNIPKELQ